MALVLEDGTGLILTANSYVSRAEFFTYWVDRFDALFDPTSNAYALLSVDRALVKATDYIELRFKNRFKGRRLVNFPDPQPLSFPRACLYVRCLPVLGVPKDLKSATCEYAKRVLMNPTGLAPDPGGYDATGQLISTKRIRVGPIEKESVYEAGTGDTLRSYPAADRLLCDFIFEVDGCIRN